MGWSDPDIIAQMEAAAGSPCDGRPDYERGYEESFRMCDELARSPNNTIRVTAKLSRAFSEQMLELRRATENSDAKTALEIIGGILTAISGAYALLLDTNDPEVSKALRAKFEDLVTTSIELRKKAKRYATPDNSD